MKNNKKDGFYIGAAMYRDLDSVEVDLILEAEGLHVDTHSVDKCKEAINKNAHWLPGGPLYDWDEIKSRVNRIRQN